MAVKFRIFKAVKISSLTYWGCSGFDGLSITVGCVSRLSNDSRNNNHYGSKVIDNNYSYRLAA